MTALFEHLFVPHLETPCRKKIYWKPPLKPNKMGCSGWLCLALVANNPFATGLSKKPGGTTLILCKLHEYMP